MAYLTLAMRSIIGHKASGQWNVRRTRLPSQVTSAADAREVAQMALVASVFVLVAGLYLALFAHAAHDFALFGWVLVVIGGLGLVARLILAGRR